MPQPPELRPEHQPWPTYPMIYRVASANEEGGERMYAVNTSDFLGTDGQVRHMVSVRCYKIEPYRQQAPQPAPQPQDPSDSPPRGRTSTLPAAGGCRGESAAERPTTILSSGDEGTSRQVNKVLPFWGS